MSKYRWEDPSVFNIGKEEGHALMLPFDSEEDALGESESKYRQSLNGQWKFHWQRGLENQPQGFEKTDFNDSDWGEIKVPSVWQTEGYSVPYYYASTFPKAISRNRFKIPKINHRMQEIGFYRRTFTLDGALEGREIFLHFGAAKAALEVYVNGEFVGYSQGSMTPHEFDVTKLIKSGENLVCAKVYRYSDGTYLEDQDMWWLCGIYHDVYLYGESKICLRDFYVKTDFDVDYKDSELSLDMYIKNYAAAKGKLTAAAKLISDTGKQLEIGEKAVTLKGGAEKISLNAAFKAPKKWSAEHPNLYTLVMTIVFNGEVQAVKTYKIGFKKVEIKNEKIYFNGMPLMIHGVNRHDFDPDCGWAVPKERYSQDLDIMKQNNINAIRTSHYPDDPYFYEMCNKYGFYVMDECDLESHGVRRKGVPGSNPVWTGQAVDRMRRMVLRDRNNPCVFMWSLGNEAGDGDNFMKMKQAALELDDSRQFHYEGDFKQDKSDVISRMYPTADVMEKLGNKQEIKISLYDNVANSLAADNKPLTPEMYEGKPIILCEYAHSMENSLGNFDEYIADFEKYDNMCGGFIWDFVDQALRVTDENGNVNYLYGTDFEGKEPKKRPIDIPNTTAMSGSNTYFCANGIIGADRQPHPQIAQVKKGYQYIKTEEFDLKMGKFKVKNQYLFTDVSAFRCKWVIKAEGEVIDSGELDKFECQPLSETFITIPYNYENLPTDREVVLTIGFFTRRKTLGIKSNYEIAWDQYILSDAPQPAEPENSGDLTYTAKGGRVSIYNNKIKVEIKNGRITRYCVDDREMLTAPIMPNYFRALTDNDIDFLNFTPMFIKFHPFYKWQRATKHAGAVKTVAKEQDNTVEVHIAFSTSGLKNAVATYKIYPDGRIYIYHSATPTANMIRFGYQMGLKSDMEYVTWYGRGPLPNYCDRKTGYKIDKYSSTVTDLEYRYMRPQESSNRTDTRYLTITDKKGNGLKISAYFSEPVNFSAYHYTTDGLEKATHINDIPYSDITTLNIDHMQVGVGGDMPGQAYVREPYLMKKGVKQAYSFVIEPVENKKVK